MILHKTRLNVVGKRAIIIFRGLPPNPSFHLCPLCYASKCTNRTSARNRFPLSDCCARRRISFKKKHEISLRNVSNYNIHIGEFTNKLQNPINISSRFLPILPTLYLCENEISFTTLVIFIRIN